MSTSMMIAMPKERVTITLDAELVAQLQEQVGEESLSAYVNEQLWHQVRREGLRQLLREMDEEFGPVPPDIAKEVDEQWAKTSSWMREQSSRLRAEKQGSAGTSPPPSTKDTTSRSRRSSSPKPSGEGRGTRRSTGS
ncbi:MAG: hypothetical protein U0V73_06630 [Acidimicrobiia bacterium]